MKASTYYYHMKTKILADFQIHISVPFKKDGEQKVLWVLKSREDIFCELEKCCFSVEKNGAVSKRRHFL